MLRYVALAFLLSSTSPGILASAAGNIGCLFSETLCNQEKEWCYDDYAFGRCLPLYGNVREEDMHRYELGTGELHGLELEMQRLFLLGYRWSHTYTQCVLQALLRAIRSKSPFDVGSCNAELDQDLEGALKAIEGEEMEHVDPKNLAIVRFTPSVINPYSGYADELYYPPIEEMLPPFRGKSEDGEPKDPNEGNLENEQKLEDVPVLPDPSTAPTTKVEEKGDKDLQDEVKTPKVTKERMSNSINNKYSLPPSAIHIPYYQDDQPYDLGTGDYDYDLSNEPAAYGLPPNPVYKRSGYINPPPVNFGELETYYRKPASKPSDLRELAHMLSNLRPLERNVGSNQPLFYDNKKMNNADPSYDFLNSRNKYSKDNDQGYFRETPSIPTFRDRVFPPFLTDKNSIYGPYDGGYKLRGSSLEPQIPELNLPPKEDDPVPETIHAGYVKEFERENYQNDQALNPNKESNLIMNQNIQNPYNHNLKSQFNNYVGKYNHYDPSSSSFNDNSVSRFEKDSNLKFNFDKPTQESGAFNWDKDVPKEDSSYHSAGYNAPIDAMAAPPSHQGQQQMMPRDSYYGKPMYPAYAFNYDYYPDYYDYGENLPPNAPFSLYPAASKKDKEQLGGEYLDIGAPAAPWNLQRDERLDVKKPGPLFKSDNDFAFNYAEEDGQGSFDYVPGNDDWVSRLDPMDGEALLLSKMRQGTGINGKLKEGHLQNTEQFPDLMLTEEGYVEAVSDDARRRGKQGYPKASQQISNKLTEEDENNKKNLQDSYVYISISGKFHSHREAEQLVHIILHMVKLDMKYIQNLSMENNQVMFQVQKNELGMTAAHLAERTEELRNKIKEKTGMEIIQAGVGTKSALSAVVYSTGERQIFTAAAIVCGVCAALLVAATVLFFLRQNSRSKAKLQGLSTHDSEASKDYQDLCRARMLGKGDSKDSSGPGHAQPVGSTGSNHAPGQRISSLSKDPENGNNSPSSRSSTSSWSEEPVISNMDISTGHMVLSYMEDHLKNKDRLDQEWVALCAYEAEPCACHLALKPENAQKNRYPDIVPYDHNRVILNEHTNVTGSNYVNASSITDHDPRNPAYIATQGPLASTAADFWQLVWEQGSVVIVMLTRLTENGQALSHRYWPEEGSELYHIYEVHLVSEHIWCDDYLVRSFYLKNARTGETRTVTQFHFLSWPESGIPASTKALLEFRRKVNKSYRGRSCPIIVHCSDGVGRTGTYCLIDMVLNRMAKGAKEIDIAATLEHIRDQRPNMVRTKTQFEFVLMAVAEEVHAILKALPQ